MAQNKNNDIKNEKIAGKNRSENDNNDTGNDSGEMNRGKNKPIYKRIGFYIASALILGVIAAAIIWYEGTLGFVTTDDAFIDADRLELGSKILARIEKLFFDEGDSVRAGQIVAALDSTDIVARLNQTKANQENLKESINLAEVNLNKAELDFNRAKVQLQNKIIPQAEFDLAQNKLAAAQAELKIAQSRYTASAADLKVIQVQLNNTKIFSGIDGVIAKKWAIEGNVIQPGQPIYSIYSNKDVWVTADLEETKIHTLALGDTVEIDVDAYPNHVFKGRVFEIGKSTASQFSLIPPSNASGNFTKVTQRIPVKISIQNGSKRPLKFGLLPGMSVEVKIKIK